MRDEVGGAQSGMMACAGSNLEGNRLGGNVLFQKMLMY